MTVAPVKQLTQQMCSKAAWCYHEQSMERKEQAVYVPSHAIWTPDMKEWCARGTNETLFHPTFLAFSWKKKIMNFLLHAVLVPECHSSFEDHDIWEEVSNAIASTHKLPNAIKALEPLRICWHTRWSLRHRPLLRHRSGATQQSGKFFQNVPYSSIRDKRDCTQVNSLANLFR